MNQPATVYVSPQGKAYLRLLWDEGLSNEEAREKTGVTERQAKRWRAEIVQQAREIRGAPTTLVYALRLLFGDIPWGTAAKIV